MSYFPQVDDVPEFIKQRVMLQVRARMNQQPQVVKRAKLLRIWIPNMVLLLMVIVLFSLSSSSNQQTVVSTTSGTVSQ
jgi:hypothetical protein